MVMTMNIIKTKLDGVVILEPNIFGDSRGFFLKVGINVIWKWLGYIMILFKIIIQKA